MTQLKHKKISMLLVCLLILLFSAAPTFADGNYNIFVVKDAFTKSDSLTYGHYMLYTLNFETKGTYRITVSTNGSIDLLFQDANVEFLPNTTSSFVVNISENMIDDKPLIHYLITYPTN